MARGRRARAGETQAAANPGAWAGLLLAESLGPVARPAGLTDRLTEQERAELLRHGRPMQLAPDEILFAQGEPHKGIYLVQSGQVRVFYASPSGREITLAYWFSGNFVGGPEIFGTSPHVWSAVATRESHVILLPAAALRALVPVMPSLAMGIIEGLVFKGKCYSTMAQILGTRSVTERLPLLLRHLMELYGVREQNNVVITAQLTHDEIARMVGATRQWITASLKRLEVEGVIELRLGTIIVRKAGRLRDEATT
jgi:CRP/FNR family cyclic AMP-dependent transcriptional regulator